jgi:hypothetical protein
VGFSREELDEVRVALRGLAGRLRASIFYVPFYDKLARWGWVPKRDDVLTAATELVGWSNSLYHEQSDTLLRRKIIADRLAITKLMDVG